VAAFAETITEHGV